MLETKSFGEKLMFIGQPRFTRVGVNMCIFVSKLNIWPQFRLVCLREEQVDIKCICDLICTRTTWNLLVHLQEFEI